MFYDYVDSGSWSESTYRDNESAFARYRLKQRVLVDLSSRSIKSKMLGREVTMPVALAPVGMTGMQWADGEILAARAAENFGVPYCLSTMSICSIEDVANAVSQPFWFQLYVMKDRDYVRRLILRAKAAQCSALVLTADLQIIGQRHKDIKNGLSTPPKPTLANLLNLATHPGWCLRMLRTKHRSFGNIVGHVAGTERLRSLAHWTNEQFDPALTWDDVQWIKDIWQGPLIIKGIMTGEDAALAARYGADAIVVSNHGGRQLDGAPATIDALADIANSVGDRTEVWLDGGIRSGQDILKALAMGASATLVGRAYQYGLGAMGEAGVKTALDILHRELDLTMAFCGVTDIGEVSREVILT